MWFTYKNSKQLDIEDKSNITLVIKLNVKYKMTRHSIQPRTLVKSFGFLSFAEKYEKQYW